MRREEVRRLGWNVAALLLLAATMFATPVATIGGYATREQLIPARPLPGNPAPSFPGQANEAAIAGSVVFRATVAPDGTVANVTVLRVAAKNMGFETATENAVSKWKFEPARNDGVPIAGTYVGRVAFQLDAVTETRLEEIVTDVIRQSHHVDSISTLFDPVLGHTHSGRDVVRGPEPASSTVAEILAGHSLSSTVSSFRYLSEELVEIEVPLTSVDESSKEAKAYAVRVNGVWRLGHFSVDPVWADFDASRIELPRKSKDRAPMSPQDARDARREGKSVIEAVTEPDGRVRNVLRLSESNSFARAVESAVHEWRYEPLRVDGQPVPMYVVVETSFTLRPDAHVDIHESVGATLK